MELDGESLQPRFIGTCYRRIKALPKNYWPYPKTGTSVAGIYRGLIFYCLGSESRVAVQTRRAGRRDARVPGTHAVPFRRDRLSRDRSGFASRLDQQKRADRWNSMGGGDVDGDRFRCLAWPEIFRREF